jgi:hypothetical protein
MSTLHAIAVVPAIVVHRFCAPCARSNKLAFPDAVLKVCVIRTTLDTHIFGSELSVAPPMSIQSLFQAGHKIFQQNAAPTQAQP